MVDSDGFRPNVGIIIAEMLPAVEPQITAHPDAGEHADPSGSDDAHRDANTQNPSASASSGSLATGRVLWTRRVGGFDAWQFPQGGIHEGETPEDALFRELHEEVGLRPEHVEIVGCTRGWLRYRLPRRLRRNDSSPGFVGQKQKWFLLSMRGSTDEIRFDCGDKAEFDGWQWVTYWHPVSKVVDFKRDVYRRALYELAPLLPVAGPARKKSSAGPKRRRRGRQQGKRARAERG